MKYKGKKVKGKNVEIIPIPRPDEDLIFIAEAVPGWEAFEKLCPEPEPPQILRPGGIKENDVNDPTFKKRAVEHAELRTHWLVLMSLQATPDLEWETVDMNDPATWNNYEKELKEAEFTPLELGRIVRGVMRANALDDDMIEAARQGFLRTREGQGN
jgi:hypothetical protein